MKLSDKAQERLNQIVERFKAGDVSPVVKIVTYKLPADVPVMSWTFSNRVLAYAQTGELDCRGFRQWESAGRNVKKGERAAYIFGPVIVKKEDKNGDEHQTCVGFRGIPVFAAEQTDGEPLPYVQEPTELPPLFDVAQAWGITVKRGPSPNSYGSFSPSRNRISLATEDARVFFHELAHAAHSRLEDLKPGQNARQETIAEFTACVLAALYGYDYTGNTWEYIRGYNEKDPLKAIMKALSTIEKVIELITMTAESLELEQAA